jgi:predicted peptidase
MNRRLSVILFVLFWLSLTALMSNAQPQAVIDCFEERTFQYTGGKYKDAAIKYRLHTPETVWNSRKYPLIIHLHGIGEAGSNNTLSLLYLDSILPLTKQQDFFMLVVQCPQETPGWNFQKNTKDGTLDVLMAAMDHVITENPIDTKRISVTGLSSGGHGVWLLILEHPDTFAAAVPTACSAPHQLSRLSALKQTSVWSIINKDIPPEPVRVAMRIINNAGGSAAVTETNLTDHNAWIPAMTEYDCFRWMLAQQRGKWFAPPPGTVIHHTPHSLPLVFVLYILPIVLIGILLWSTVCEWVAAAWQSVQEWSQKI